MYVNLLHSNKGPQEGSSLAEEDFHKAYVSMFFSLLPMSFSPTLSPAVSCLGHFVSGSLGSLFRITGRITGAGNVQG